MRQTPVLTHRKGVETSNPINCFLVRLYEILVSTIVKKKKHNVIQTLQPTGIEIQKGNMIEGQEEF